MTNEQRALERERERLHQPARAGLVRRPELRLRLVQRHIEPAVCSTAKPQLGHQRVARLWFFLQRAQDVETDDVARTFPDGIERRLPVQAGQDRFLDVPVAPEALER